MKRRLIIIVSILCIGMILTGCNEDKKIAKLKIEFDEAMEEWDFAEAEDILRNMRFIDSSNDQYREAKGELKKATDVKTKIDLCSSIRTAFITAISHPSYFMSSDYGNIPDDFDVTLQELLNMGGPVYEELFVDSLDQDVDEIYEDYYIVGDIKVMLENGNECTVYIDDGKNNISIYYGSHDF